MRPLKRYVVNKRNSAKHFNRKSKRTNKRNLASPMRGGIRL